MIPQLASAPIQSPPQTRAERGWLLFQGSGWYRAARLLLWTVIATAGIRPTEVVGTGEQIAGVSLLQTSPIDLLFRCTVFVVCLSTAFFALSARRVRVASLRFVPFLIWGVLVSVGQQSDLFSIKQLGSYATWILFFISASALLDQAADYATLRVVTVISVLTSAIAGVVQHALGYAPMVGFIWENVGFTRIHTGGGGILLDAFTPYCAALLLLATSRNRPILQGGGVLLALWGSGNILRGGIVGFSVAMVWLLAVVPKGVKLNLLRGACASALLIGLCFGNKIIQKSLSSGDEINTSGRFEHWPELVEWIRQEPLWGHGPNADMRLLEKGGGRGAFTVAHNEVLSTAVNYGIIGTVLLCYPLLTLLLRTLRLAYKHRRWRPEQLWGASAVLLMVAVLSLTDNTLRTPGVMILALAPVSVALNTRVYLRAKLA